METFVKLRPTARVSLAGWKADEKMKVTAAVHRANYALDLSVESLIVAKEKGGFDLVSSVKANQSFVAALGTVSPTKYTVMATLHPMLQNRAAGPSTMLVEPGDTLDLTLHMKARAAIDLTELPYFVRLYVIG